MELIELMVVWRAAGKNFRADATRGATRGLLSLERETVELMELIKLLSIKSPKRACMNTKSPFEAFLGLQKAPKVPKWLKRRPDRKSFPTVELMELIELMVVRRAAGIFFRADAARCDARTTLPKERNSGIDEIDKTIGRPSKSPKRACMHTKPPFRSVSRPSKST